MLRLLVSSLLVSIACSDEHDSSVVFDASSNFDAPAKVDSSSEPSNYARYDVRKFGALGNGVADDTAAIQKAIDAAALAGGGTVFFPPGKYLVGGELKDVDGANAQLTLPSVFTYADQPLPIVLEGPFPPATNYSLYMPQSITERGAVLLSKHRGGGSVIGVHGPVGSFEKFSNIAAIVRNLIVRTYPDPDITALNLGLAFSAEVDDVIVDTGITVMNDIPQPTHPNAYGIIAPALNNGALVAFDRVQVVGFHTGIRYSEHFTANLIQLWSCRFPLEAAGANHASYIARALVVWSPTTLRAADGIHPMHIDQLAIEHRNPAMLPLNSWENPIPGQDVHDPMNYLVGDLTWFAVKADVGGDPSFGVTGGSNLIVKRLGER